MGKKAYKAGLVSTILATSASDSGALDPKLCAIFGSKQFALKPPASSESIQAIIGNDVGVGKTNKKSKKLKASNRSEETAEQTSIAPLEPQTEKIKIKKKRKLDSSADGISSDVTAPKKAKKKKKGGNVVTERIDKITEAASTSDFTEQNDKDSDAESLLPKKKAKKQKTAVEAGKPVKKFAKQKKPKAKVDRDNDKIIAELERENENSGDEATADKEKRSSVLKIFELNAPKEKDAEKESRTIFVGNLPTDTKEKTLIKLFKDLGKIETIRFRGAIPLKPYYLKKVAINSKKLNPDQYNVTAYIRFKTREEAENAAVKMNGQLFNSHYLVVDLADNEKHDNKRAVFVGNLPLKIRDDELRAFFAECGAINSVRIIRSAVTGLGKGFGYVNFQSPDCVELALKKDGETLDGRQIRVSRAVKKEKKTKEQILKQKANELTAIQNLNKSNAQKRLARKNLPANISFTGDKRAETGSSKKSKKPNRGELKNAKIAAKLMGVPTSQVKRLNQKTKKRPTK